MTTVLATKPRTRRKKTTKKKKEVKPFVKPYDKITKTIIEKLEAGEIPWKRPWKKTAIFPRSFNTGKHYRGYNFNSLLAEEYYIPQFMTFLQIRNNGFKLKAGSKGHEIFFFSKYERKYKDKEKKILIPENEREESIALKSYTVFNVTQLTECPPDLYDDSKEIENFRDNLDIEEFIAKIGVRIEHDSQRAYYDPNIDYINMPKKSEFKNEDAYYATLFHELTHWTKDVNRCDRPQSQKQGDKVYSFEELIAELGSQMLCDLFKISSEESVTNSAGYIQSWLKKLKNDNKLVYKASNQAFKAFEYLLDKGGIDINML